jgi:hypothetical protein
VLVKIRIGGGPYGMQHPDIADLAIWIAGLNTDFVAAMAILNLI